MGALESVYLGPEGEALMNGIHEDPYASLPCEDSKKKLVMNQDEGPHQNKTVLAPWTSQLLEL